MHEHHLMKDLLRRIEAVAAEHGSHRVLRVRVRLGALSHFDPDHFREHYERAAAGTVGEGAVVDAVLSEDVVHPDAQSVVLESLELEE